MPDIRRPTGRIFQNKCLPAAAESRPPPTAALFFEKSIQVDFPLAYSQPAKRFLKTGDSQISQIYVSQFDSRTMRVRFVIDQKGEANFKNRFHMKKEGDSLVVRIDREPADILGQLLARTTEKIKEKKPELSIKKIYPLSMYRCSSPIPAITP